MFMCFCGTAQKLLGDSRSFEVGLNIYVNVYTRVWQMILSGFSRSLVMQLYCSCGFLVPSV